ncbi:MAG: phage tail terminator protein [Alcaligenes nematophilus]|uniref:phage tail terminator protein n=1 Tax=Alcaligenes TaxID=507 RepID=UPI001EEFA7B8|nr:hypothetical protein [Alcaligenes faecalis]ULH05339.1 hypothetical protein MF263_11600 [Alcaligenes faecalis]
MKLSDVVGHLRTYCRTFDNRVFVAIDFKPERGQVSVEVPSLVVMPADDEARAPIAQNLAVQEVTDRFTVVLMMATASNERGDATADALHDLRAEVWRALLGWRPGEEYEPIEYEGGEIIDMNRAVTYYGMTFSSELTVGYSNGLPADATPQTWQEYELAQLPPLSRLNISVDVIDPIADPNLQKPGPDGRTEFKLSEDVS